MDVNFGLLKMYELFYFFLVLLLKIRFKTSFGFFSKKIKMNCKYDVVEFLFIVIFIKNINFMELFSNNYIQEQLI